MVVPMSKRLAASMLGMCCKGDDVDEGGGGDGNNDEACKGVTVFDS